VASSNLGYYSSFSWRDGGKLRKPSVRLVSVPGEIRAGYLLNASEKRVLFELACWENMTEEFTGVLISP